MLCPRDPERFSRLRTIDEFKKALCASVAKPEQLVLVSLVCTCFRYLLRFKLYLLTSLVCTCFRHLELRSVLVKQLAIFDITRHLSEHASQSLQ
jgi:hypothetical protein